MDYDKLFQQIEKCGNVERKRSKEKYMRNLFSFVGLTRLETAEIIKPYFHQMKNEKNLDWNFVNKCWKKPYREAQYIGVYYLMKFCKKLKKEDLEKVKQLVIEKSWWDTIDLIATNVVGKIVLLDREKLEKIMLKWSFDDNFWIKRVAILHQLKYKKETNENLLEKILVNNFGTKEFFVNKAIGWALREYSKTNKQFVKKFIEKYKHQMSHLSIKEGSKYI